MVKENLERALARFGVNGEYWTRRNLVGAKNWLGVFYGDDVRCYCMIGALLPDNHSPAEFSRAYLSSPELAALAGELGDRPDRDLPWPASAMSPEAGQVAEFNDFDAETFDEVRAVYLAAIEHSE